MGGVDISASVAPGDTVNIGNVTGDIVITCMAAITNIIDTIGISSNTRLSTSSGANKAQTGYATIGANKDITSLIHLKDGDTLRIKGASLSSSTDTNCAIVRYDANAVLISATYVHNGLTWNNMTFTDNGSVVTITAKEDNYIRITLICTDASAVIATLN